jgi:hypothetical protein
MMSLLLLSACAPGVSGGRPDTAGIRNEELHAVMTDHIVGMIAQLDVLAFDLHRTETEIEDERLQRAVWIADSAVELQRAADMIIAIQPTLLLNQEGAENFDRLANQLKDFAIELEDVAARRQLAGFRPLMERINGTCNACHRIYRGR